MLINSRIKIIYGPHGPYISGGKSIYGPYRPYISGGSPSMEFTDHIFWYEVQPQTHIPKPNPKPISRRPKSLILINIYPHTLLVGALPTVLVTPPPSEPPNSAADVV